LIFVDKLKKEGLGPAAIAKRLRISRASVYRAMAA
jgi:transposase